LEAEKLKPDKLSVETIGRVVLEVIEFNVVLKPPTFKFEVP
jgi:hypothetical protein